MTFPLQAGDLQAGASPFTSDLLSVEFRSPSAKTLRLHAFWSEEHLLTVRFSPTEPGAWTARVTSEMKRYDQQQSSFSVVDSGSPGFVSVANVRHWRTTNKQPHLWLGAEYPPAALGSAALANWLDDRKHNGFTHIRTTLLTASGTRPFFGAGDTPVFASFDALDREILASVERAFTLDLILADEKFLQTGLLKGDGELVLRYIISRYAGMNVTWQGVTSFDRKPGARELLKSVAQALSKYDPYVHPKSSDAALSSSPLLPDGWTDYLMEASASPDLGSVEHQFTHSPQIHVVNSTNPTEFRNELWNSTANGEYPSISYESLKDAGNVKAVQVWQKLIANTRHWEFEPYFDVSGARAAGLDEVEYVAYAQTPGIVEISLPRHKYNPLWVNPSTGEELELKNYRGEVLSRQTPDNERDWILQVPRNGEKESMRSYRFESVDPPAQEIEADPARVPFVLVEPAGDEIDRTQASTFKLKMTKSNRSTRTMQFLWWGEAIGSPAGPRLLGIGPSGSFTIPPVLLSEHAETFNLRIQALNTNGKAFELDRIYRLH